MIDLMITHATLVTCASNHPKRGAAMRDVGLIEDGAVAIENGLIVDVGTTDVLLRRYELLASFDVLDVNGKVVCPGFVDAHTHVVYAGDRASEFEMRIQGKSYMEIMAAGGGILSTMQQVRQASIEGLVRQTHPRLNEMLAHGTTTAEIKTGYGLNLASEIEMLFAIALLDQLHPMTLIPTFLGAHAIPPEYTDRAEEYTQHVIETMIPAAAKWYSDSHFATEEIPFFIDVFCEKNAFTVDQAQRVLQAGIDHGMQVKAHVDEFVNLGGAKMAVDLGAVSIDHLDVTSAKEIEHLAHSNTVSVVIPAVNFNFGSTDFADARGMIDAGAALALATDYNPGSAPCPSMQLVMAIACRYQHLLPSEALNASTINAAYAVGMGDRIGSIETGKQADLLVLNAPDYRHLAYHFGGNLVEKVIKNGKIL